jgi:hypothetical protein
MNEYSFINLAGESAGHIRDDPIGGGRISVTAGQRRRQRGDDASDGLRISDRPGWPKRQRFGNLQ